MEPEWRRRESCSNAAAYGTEAVEEERERKNGEEESKKGKESREERREGRCRLWGGVFTVVTPLPCRCW